MSQTLQGLRLWVTRPSQQAAELCALLGAAGAEVLALPLLEITPAADPAALSASITDLARFDLAIFVSPSALDAVFAQLDKWPTSLPLAVVGLGSARRARELGVEQIICPHSQFDSEGLLLEPGLQNLQNKSVVLFRGNGGRELLPEILQKRGAKLTIISAYQRQAPRFNQAHLQNELAAGCDGIVISSSEAAQHLFRLAGDGVLQALQSRVYFVPHPRIAETLIALGAKQVELTKAGDQGILRGLQQYFSLPRQETKPR